MLQHNYSIKSPQYSYEKEFDRIRKKYNLKGQIKMVSNIACEYIMTSDYDFFERIGEEETNRQHYSAEEYKKITNFNQTKEILKNMNLEAEKQIKYEEREKEWDLEY